MIDPKNQHTISVLQASTSKTANWNSATILDMQQYVGQIAVILNAGAATAGTSPTLDVVLHGSNESNGANSATLSISATQVTDAANSHQVLTVDPRATAYRYLKAVATIGGTNSPAFPVGMSAVGTKKLQ